MIFGINDPSKRDGHRNIFLKPEGLMASFNLELQRSENIGLRKFCCEEFCEPHLVLNILSFVEVKLLTSVTNTEFDYYGYFSFDRDNENRRKIWYFFPNVSVCRNSYNRLKKFRRMCIDLSCVQVLRLTNVRTYLVARIFHSANNRSFPQLRILRAKSTSFYNSSFKCIVNQIPFERLEKAELERCSRGSRGYKDREVMFADDTISIMPRLKYFRFRPEILERFYYGSQKSFYHDINDSFFAKRKFSRLLHLDIGDSPKITGNSFTELPNLRTLSLTNLPKFDDRCLLQLPRLENLHLFHMKCDLNSQNWRNLKNLSSLTLNHSNFKGEFPPILSKHPKLKKMEITTGLRYGRFFASLKTDSYLCLEEMSIKVESGIRRILRRVKFGQNRLRKLKFYCPNSELKTPIENYKLGSNLRILEISSLHLPIHSFFQINDHQLTHFKAYGCKTSSSIGDNIIKKHSKTLQEIVVQNSYLSDSPFQNSEFLCLKKLSLQNIYKFQITERCSITGHQWNQSVFQNLRVLKISDCADFTDHMFVERRFPDLEVLHLRALPLIGSEEWSGLLWERIGKYTPFQFEVIRCPKFLSSGIPKSVFRGLREIDVNINECNYYYLPPKIEHQVVENVSSYFGDSSTTKKNFHFDFEKMKFGSVSHIKIRPKRASKNYYREFHYLWDGRLISPHLMPSSSFYKGYISYREEEEKEYRVVIEDCPMKIFTFGRVVRGKSSKHEKMVFILVVKIGRRMFKDEGGIRSPLRTRRSGGSEVVCFKMVRKLVENDHREKKRCLFEFEFLQVGMLSIPAFERNGREFKTKIWIEE